ncbi:MAG: hypothetical protein A2045_16580 [Rhodocyclales bacterium GWA2_65_20]|nr:MAG: hypothetical protein A2045_16580 [Rhodocyclales bacterium GWA2_65_20]
MTYKQRTDLLADYCGKPWSDLPEEQRQIWREVWLLPDPDGTGAAYWWDKVSPDVRLHQVKSFDYNNDPAREGERHVICHDGSMNARTYFDMPDVMPRDAAMVLCRLNPLKTEDPENINVDGDESSPARYRLLLAMFESVARASPKPRRLMEWRAIAQEHGLRYHEWVDKYVKATGLDSQKLGADNSSVNGAAPENGQIDRSDPKKYRAHLLRLAEAKMTSREISAHEKEAGRPIEPGRVRQLLVEAKTDKQDDERVAREHAKQQSSFAGQFGVHGIKDSLATTKSKTKSP